MTALECFVRRALGEDDFEVRWFRENASGIVEPLGFGDPELGPMSQRRSRYHHTKFLHQQYNPSFLGKYWCQVINTTADPYQPLMRSNVFTLLAPENYTGPTCGGGNSVQVIQNKSCADLPDHVGPLLPTAMEQAPSMTLAHPLSSHRQTQPTTLREPSFTITKMFSCSTSYSTPLLQISTVELIPTSLNTPPPTHSDPTSSIGYPIRPVTETAHIRATIISKSLPATSITMNCIT